LISDSLCGGGGGGRKGRFGGGLDYMGLIYTYTIFAGNYFELVWDLF